MSVIKKKGKHLQTILCLVLTICLLLGQTPFVAVAVNDQEVSITGIAAGTYRSGLNDWYIVVEMDVATFTMPSVAGLKATVDETEEAQVWFQSNAAMGEKAGRLAFTLETTKAEHYTVHENLKTRYAQAVKHLERSVNGREFDYLFDFQAKLLTLLTRKCDLGLRLRNAYQAGDKAALQQILNEEFVPMKQEIRDVYESFRTLWYRENKSIGFELQEMRFGALMLRTKSCARMLCEYLEGVRDKIEELEEPMLPGHYGMEGKAETFNSYLQTISANSDAF